MGKGKKRRIRIAGHELTPCELNKYQQKMEFKKMALDDASWAELIKIAGSRMSVARWKKAMRGPDFIPADLEKILAEKNSVRKEISQPVEEEKNLDLLTFVESEEWLGFPLFPAQRIIFKAFYGLEFTDGERKILLRWKQEGKTTWEEGEAYTELVVVGGMKGGKTPLASAFACAEEFELYRAGDISKKWGFARGEEVFIINVATDKFQARDTIFADIEARISNSKFYKKRKERGDYDNTEYEFDFKSERVKIRSGHSNSASIVGKLAKLVLFDELARFTSKDGKYSGERVYTALNRSPTPFKKDGRIISISSPLEDDDIIMSLYKLSAKVDGMLGFHLATWEMNPNIPFEDPWLQRELKKNPEKFWRDYGAKPSQTIEAYYRDLHGVEQTFKRSKAIRCPVEQGGRFKSWFGNKEKDHYLHLDPAVNNCGFGIGLCHREGDRFKIDLAHRFRPGGNQEIDYERIKDFLLEIASRFRIKKATYDTYMAVSLYQALQKEGIECELLNVNLGVQERLKEMINLDRVDVYWNPVLEWELKNLELVNGRKVEPRKGKTKDIVDGVAGALWPASQEEDTEPMMVEVDPQEEGDYSVFKSRIFGRHPAMTIGTINRGRRRW